MDKKIGDMYGLKYMVEEYACGCTVTYPMTHEESDGGMPIVIPFLWVLSTHEILVLVMAMAMSSPLSST